MILKQTARAMAISLAISSCATAQRPVNTHIISTPAMAEHDETVSTNGTIDYYPNANDPAEIVLKGSQAGQFIDIKCLTPGCQTSRFKIVGSPFMADGDYLTVKTDDPNITMVRDIGGEQTLGYLATNDHSHAIKYVGNIKDANDFEHKGDTLRMAGKVAVFSLLVGVIIVAAIYAGPALEHANSHPDTVTTTCTNYVFTTTCTTR